MYFNTQGEWLPIPFLIAEIIYISDNFKIALCLATPAFWSLHIVSCIQDQIWVRGLWQDFT